MSTIYESVHSQGDARPSHDYPSTLYDVARAGRVRGNLGAFAGGLLNGNAMDVAGRVELLENARWDRELSFMAAQAIYGSWQKLGEETGILYESSLLAGVMNASTAAGAYVDRLAETPSGELLLRQMEQGDIETDFWVHGKVGVDTPAIVRLANSTDVEALIISGADTLDKAASFEAGSPELFDSVLKMETVFSPQHDSFGLLASEMMQRSVISKKRLESAGRRDLVEEAEVIINEINKVNAQEETLRLLFGKVPEHTVFEAPKGEHYGEQFHYSVYELSDLTDGRWGGRLHVRVKTVGGLADKMASNPAYANTLPQDIVGMKFVVPDMNQLADCMEYVIGKMYNSEALKPAIPPSKKKAASVQGPSDFIEELEACMDPEVFRHVQEIEKGSRAQNSLEMAKVMFDSTIQGKVVPCEVQFYTKEGRENERFGAPHYNAKKSKDIGMPPPILATPSDIRQMNQRKHDLMNGNRFDLDPIDSASGRRLRAEVLALLTRSRG